MSDDDEFCGENPIGDLSPKDQAVDLAYTMDRFAKVDLISHWSFGEVAHAFGHCSREVRGTALYTWASMLNIQVRATVPNARNKMLLWDRLPCHEEMQKEAAADANLEDMGKVTEDGMRLMNFASEDAAESEVSLFAVRCAHFTDVDAEFSWWMGLMLSIAHFADHVGTDSITKIVSEYGTAHPHPNTHQVRLIGGQA